MGLTRKLKPTPEPLRLQHGTQGGCVPSVTGASVKAPFEDEGFGSHGERVQESQPSLLESAARTKARREVRSQARLPRGRRGAQHPQALHTPDLGQCGAACIIFMAGRTLLVSGVRRHLWGCGPLGALPSLNSSGVGEGGAYSIGIRNCTVSSGWAMPGRTSWMKKLVRKTRSWGLPSWYKVYNTKNNFPFFRGGVGVEREGQGAPENIP